MAEQFNAEWARGIIDGGIENAQNLINEPAKIDELLQQIQEKLAGLPASAAKAFSNVPTMAAMVKGYVTQEYTDVSPKVVVALVSAFLYLVKRKDLIPDDIPVVGYVDDIAVLGIALAISEPELNAFKEWNEQKALEA